MLAWAYQLARPARDSYPPAFQMMALQSTHDRRSEGTLSKGDRCWR